MPSTRALPASWLKIVVRMRTAVVLPAPFGPEQPEDRAAFDVQVDTVEGDDVAEVLDQPFDGDHRIGAAGARTGAGRERSVMTSTLAKCLNGVKY